MTCAIASTRHPPTSIYDIAFRYYASLIIIDDHLLSQPAQGRTRFAEESEQRREKKSVVVNTGHPRPWVHEGEYKSATNEPLGESGAGCGSSNNKFGGGLSSGNILSISSGEGAGLGPGNTGALSNWMDEKLFARLGGKRRTDTGTPESVDGPPLSVLSGGFIGVIKKRIKDIVFPALSADKEAMGNCGVSCSNTPVCSLIKDA